MGIGFKIRVMILELVELFILIVIVKLLLREYV